MTNTALEGLTADPPAEPVRAAVEDEAVAARLFALARQVARGPGLDAEEIAQEARKRAWEKRDTFDPEAGTPATQWLYGFVRHIAREHLRRAGKAPRQSDGTWDKPVDPTHEDGLDLADALLVLHRYLGQLPARLKEAVELKYLHELEYPDIAARLGITQDNARARVSRGFLQLRALAAKEVRS